MYLVESCEGREPATSNEFDFCDLFSCFGSSCRSRNTPDIALLVCKLCQIAALWMTRLGNLRRAVRVWSTSRDLSRRFLLPDHNLVNSTRLISHISTTLSNTFPPLHPTTLNLHHVPSTTVHLPDHGILSH